MADMVVRPTLKFIKIAYLLVLIVIAGAFAGWYAAGLQPVWVPSFLALLLLWPLARHIRSRSSKITVEGEKLRYQSGLLAKSTRTIQVPKIQDVRVDQSLFQRMFNVGNLSIETAGESSRLTLPNIDAPQAIADTIMARAQGSTQAQHI